MRDRISRALVLGLGLALLVVLPGCPDGGDATLGDGGGGGGDAVQEDGGGGPCIQTCEWRECGPDPTCGASCGGCTANEVCDKGSCIPPGCVPDCSGVECGVEPVCGAYCAGCPDGETCEDGECVVGTCEPQCGRRECGPDPVCFESCGGCGADEHCVDGTCVEGTCQQDCAGRFCGPDPVCGLACGVCEDYETCVDGTCVCVPACDGLSCGDDGCGGQCRCEGDGCLCIAGRCECGCEPDCAGRQCGPDPVCGEVCGTCAEGCTCSADGQCLGCGDEPCCEGRECGVEPCTGTSCGTCGDDEECSEAGQCIPIGCDPVCGERECGPDPVCGDSCGTCGEGCACDVSTGSCVCGVEGACANDADIAILNTLDPVELSTECVLALNCVQPSCYAECIRDRTGISADCSGCYGTLAACGVEHCIEDCVADHGGPACLACLDGWCMADFETCAGVELLPCEAECGGRECGPDPVCGESCGECRESQHCEDGECVAGPCVPDCSDVECGPDPVCGQSCGGCPGGSQCIAGTCIALPPGDACVNAADLALLDDLDAAAVAQTCLMQMQCSFDDAACIAECIRLETGLSADCSLCFGGLAVCGVDHCLGVCLSDQGEPCLACLTESCQGDFVACAGVTWTGGECTPDCDGLACGPDPVCGQSCGECRDGEECVAGSCEAVEPPPGNACNNADDLTILNALDANAVAQECLLAAGCGTDQACITECIRSETGVSEDCAGCYGGLAVCGLDNCLATCWDDQGGVDCMACLGTYCRDDFEACSGITWTSGECVPECGAAQCGDDGCGGSCGECEAGELCQEGACVGLPQDACDNQSDLAIIADIDYQSLVTTCVMDCWTDTACLSGCVVQETGMSEDCAVCFGAGAGCAAEFCLNVCLSNPQSAACTDCLYDNCAADFETCSGIGFIILPSSSN